MLPVSEYIANPTLLGLALLRSFGSRVLSDKLYLKIRYRLEMGKPLDLNNPKTFTEKLQWLKLYNRCPEYTIMVDKFAVKDYVVNLVGKDYVIPTLGCWNTPDEVNFDCLPEQFVLKTTNGGGGGGVVICRDKATFNRKRAIDRLNKSLKSDIYRTMKEWPYKNVAKRILAEKYMEESTAPQTELSDYKFYCFNGIPKLVMVSTGRFSNELCFDYYDMSWKKLSLVWDKPNSNYNHLKPECFDEMVMLCEKLSKDIPHVRVDLYVINNRPYFGELTFFDASGFSHFEDEKWNYCLGEMIKLPPKSTK